MGQAAAKKGDHITASDTHAVQTESSPPVLTPHPFDGLIDNGLCDSVLIMGAPAATVGSTATNTPAHLPIPANGTFVNPPSNKASIILGSSSVLIGGKPAARNGDTANTCNEAGDLPVGSVVASGSVLIG